MEQEPCRPTEAELAVLRLLAAGLTSEEIAVALGITPSTVRSRLRRLQRRCGCRNRVELVRLAFREGWLE